MLGSFSRTTSGNVLVSGRNAKKEGVDNSARVLVEVSTCFDDGRTPYSISVQDPPPFDTSTANPSVRQTQNLRPATGEAIGSEVSDFLTDYIESSDLESAERQCHQSIWHPIPSAVGPRLDRNEDHQVSCRRAGVEPSRVNGAHRSNVSEWPKDHNQAEGSQGAKHHECADWRVNNKNTEELGDERHPKWIRKTSSLAMSSSSDLQSTDQSAHVYDIESRLIANSSSSGFRHRDGHHRESKSNLSSLEQTVTQASQDEDVGLENWRSFTHCFKREKWGQKFVLRSAERAERLKFRHFMLSAVQQFDKNFSLENVQMHRSPSLKLEPSHRSSAKVEFRRLQFQELTERFLKLDSMSIQGSDQEQSDRNRPESTSPDGPIIVQQLNRQFFENMEVRQNIRPHNCLDKELTIWRRNRNSHSFKFAITKWTALVLCFFVGTGLMYLGTRSLHVWLSANRSPVDAIRFNLDSVPEDVLNTSLLRSKFKFWNSDCEIVDMISTVNGQSIIFNGTVPGHPITAFEFQSGGLELLVKTVDHFSDGQLTAKRGPIWKQSWNGEVVQWDDHTEPGADGTVHRLSPPWSWPLANAIVLLILSLTMFACLLSVLGSTTLPVHTSIRYGCLLCSVLYGIHSVTLLALSMFKAAFIPILHTVVMGKIAWEMQSPHTNKILRSLLSLYFVHNVGVAIEIIWLRGTPASVVKTTEVILAFIVAVIVVSIVSITSEYRRRNLQRLRTRFEETGVSRAWKNLMRENNNSAKAKRIDEFLSLTFPGLHGNSGFRHSYRPAKRQDVDDRNTENKPLFRNVVDLFSGCKRATETIDMLPTQSLDQLYQQAAAMQPILMGRLKQWAAQSKAWLPARRQPRDPSESGVDSSCPERNQRDFVLYTGEEQDSLVSWPTLKAFDSALHKIVMRREGDVSSCYDIARGVLLFDHFEGLADALQALAFDEYVSLKGVRSNMSNEDSGNPFRFIKVNFCFVSEDTVVLGIEGFICELILTFKEIWSAKDVAEYQEWRSLQDGLRGWGGSSLCPYAQTGQKGPLSYHIDIRSQRLPSSSEQRARAFRKMNIFEPDVTATHKSRFRESSCTPAGQQDKELLEDVEEAVRSADPASVWLMASPFDAALAKPEYFLLLVLLFLAIIGAIILQLQRWSVTGSTGTHFRFISHATRGGRDPKIETFGLLFGGCFIEKAENSPSFDTNYTAHLNFHDTGVKYDGWYFVTPGENSDFDPIIFSLDVKAGGGAWKTIGTSGSLEIAPGIYHHELAQYNTPLKRLEIVSFPLQATGTSRGGIIAESCVILVFSLILIHRQVNKLHYKSQHYFTAAVSAYGITTLVSSLLAMQTLSGSWQPQLLFGLVACLVASSLASGRGFSLVSEIFMGCFGFAAVLFVAWDWVYYGKQVSPRMVPYSVYPGFLLGFVIKILQLFTWRRITILMERDKKLNLEVWDGIIKREGEIQQLQQVAKLLQPYTMPTSSGVHQRGVEFHGSFETAGTLNPPWWGDVSFKVPDGNNSVGVLQTSLSLLLHQARSLQPFLFEKIQELSLASNGLVPIGSDNKKTLFIPFSEILEEPRLLEAVKWPPLKKMDRIRQKLVRCYKSDASKLCDLCRGTIVHRSAADLLACMQLLMKDKDIHVVRTKNSMDPDSDPQHLSAFRQISVNVMISTQGSRQMGVSMHVAELQLLLLPFAEIKTLDGHKRYILLRDARGE